MREIFAGVPPVGQRCASPINSCQSGADKQFVQVTTALGYDDCIVTSWSENHSPTSVDRERLCKSACREYFACGCAPVIAASITTPFACRRGGNDPSSRRQ